MSSVVAKETTKTTKVSSGSNNNGKQSNSQGGNEPRKILQNRREGKGGTEGKIYSPKTENIWSARTSQNPKQGTKTESQGVSDELSQKFGAGLHLSDEKAEQTNQDQRPQKKTNRPSGSSGYKSSPPQRGFKKGNVPATEKENDKGSPNVRPRREFVYREGPPQNQPPENINEQEQEVDDSEETGGSPNNSSAAKSKPKVKLSLAQFISTVGGDENSEEEIPSRVLWVGNIGPEVSEEELTQEFMAYGKLESLRILHDRFCAFVNFEEQECAKKAKTGLNGTIIGSQYIVINYRKADSKPAQSSLNASPVNSENNFILNTPSRALWIGNISDEVTEQDLFTEFSQFGGIESVRLLTHKTCAFVNFMNVEDATNALHTLQGKELGNMPIKINFGKPPKRLHDVFGQYVPTSYIPQPYYPTEYQPYGYPPSPYLNPHLSPYLPVGSLEPTQFPLYLHPTNVCDICGANAKETLALPCGHSFSCKECLIKLSDKSKCYYCLAAVEKYIPLPFGAFSGYSNDGFGPSVAPQTPIVSGTIATPSQEFASAQ